MWRMMLVLVGVALVLAACGRARVAATPRPVMTVTPFSTPLPDVPTPLPLGDAERPIGMTIAFAQVGSDNHDALQAALAAQNLNVVVTSADGQTAIAALCDLEQPSLAWLQGFDAALALLNDCADPVLWQVRGEGRAAQTGASVQMLLSDALESREVADATSGTFCRLGLDDFATWLAPLLMLRARGLTLDAATIVEKASLAEIFAGLNDGTCGLAAAPKPAVDAYREANEAAFDVAFSSPEFPYGVLFMPRAIPLPTYDDLIAFFVTSAVVTSEATAEASAEPLLTATEIPSVLFLGDFAWERMGRAELQDLRDFMVATGYDFSTLGQ